MLSSRHAQELLLEALEYTGRMLRIDDPPLLTACFDESGKLRDHNIVCFGGCVSNGDGWHNFCGLWLDRLEKDGLNYISMKEALYLKGCCEHLDNERRDKLLLDLAHILVESQVVRIYSFITSAAFEAFSQADQRRFADPVYYGFEACTVAAFQSQKRAIHIVYDLSEEYSEKSVALFNTLRKKNPLMKERCLALTFADDHRHAGVQAADMVAYCKRVEKSGSEPTRLVVNDMIRLLETADKTDYKFTYTGGSMEPGTGVMGA